MTTKRIWLLSFVFGTIASLVAYFVLFSNDLSVAKTTSSTKGESTPVVSKEKSEDAPEIVKRKVPNPLLPVSEGMRAISLRVSLEQGVSGFVEPNSYIDIISYESRIDGKTKKEYRSAKLLLQNKKVLGIGKSSDGDDSALQYETVTIEVTAKEGVMLSLASEDKGGFYLMLRNEKDQTIEEQSISFTREVIKGGQ